MKFDIKLIGKIVCCIIIFCLCIMFVPGGMNSISNEKSEGFLPDFLPFAFAQEVNGGNTSGTGSENMSENKVVPENNRDKNVTHEKNNENNSAELINENGENVGETDKDIDKDINEDINSTNSANITNSTNDTNKNADNEIINGNDENIKIIGDGFYTHKLFFTEDAQRYVIVYPDDSYVSLTRNEESEHKSYDEICGFLQTDKTDENIYVPETYVCINYAADLVNAAEKSGISCGLLLLTFEGDVPSHTLNAFVLEDGQIMYVDTTGFTDKAGTDRYFFELEIGDYYEEMGIIYKMYEFW